MPHQNSNPTLCAGVIFQQAVLTFCHVCRHACRLPALWSVPAGSRGGACHHHLPGGSDSRCSLCPTPTPLWPRHFLIFCFVWSRWPADPGRGSIPNGYVHEFCALVGFTASTCCSCAGLVKAGAAGCFWVSWCCCVHLTGAVDRGLTKRHHDTDMYFTRYLAISLSASAG